MSTFAFTFDEVKRHEIPQFDNLTEKVSYWKQTAEVYRNKLQSMQDNFGQYHDNSRKFEAEMEAKLEEYEERISALLSSKDKLETENDDLMEKLEDTVKHTFVHITELDNENIRMAEVESKMTNHIKDLVNKNEGLESGKKATYVLLDRYKGSLEEALEKNLHLELKLKDKEQEIVRLKRLKDEVRDLKGALAITVRDKAYLKQSKLEYEEAQAYAKFMNMVDKKHIQAHAQKTVDEPTPVEEKVEVPKEKRSLQPAIERTGNVISKLANYKNYIQGLMLGTGKATECIDCEPLDASDKINSSKSEIPARKESKSFPPPVGISDHYVDMINNLSTRERISYSINKKK